MEEVEEYELIPLSPIRRLEKKMDRIEKAGTSAELMKDLLGIVRTNQDVVEDVVKINSEMIKKVSELSDSIASLNGKLNDFINRIEVVGAEETAKKEENKTIEIEKKFDERLAKLEKRLNTLIVSTMAKRRTVPAQRMSTQPLQI